MMHYDGGSRLEGQEAALGRIGSRVGHLGMCSRKTRGEEPSGRFIRKRVTEDESPRDSDGRIANRKLEQGCEASPC